MCVIDKITNGDLTMTGKEFKRRIDAIGLTPTTTAEAIGVSRSTIYRAIDAEEVSAELSSKLVCLGIEVAFESLRNNVLKINSQLNLLEYERGYISAP
jgi:plasmid maintenance system antidote protein VapI